MWLAAVCSASVLGGSLALPAWRQLIAATAADAPVSIRS
jgi:hypothetical protein